jgi:hypothetical protein
MAETDQAVEPQAKSRWQPAEIFWLGVLVVSILVGFGMTIFAPV